MQRDERDVGRRVAQSPYEVVREQVELYGTLTGQRPASGAPARRPAAPVEEAPANVLPLQRRARG